VPSGISFDQDLRFPGLVAFGLPQLKLGFGGLLYPMDRRIGTGAPQLRIGDGA